MASDTASDDGYDNFLSFLHTSTTKDVETIGDVELASTSRSTSWHPDVPSPFESEEESADADYPINGSKKIVRKMTSRRASTSEERRNPFAEREGNALIWSGVNMTLIKKKEEKIILKDVWGEVPPGEITAIMGPSGAGKSSLLNILAGRSSSTASLSVEHDIRMNDFKVDPTNIEVRKQIAFVAQDDSLSITSTPREAIRFSAKLRLPRITTDEEIEYLADKMLAELGLKECADTMVGGALIKGISGGERKRTSVGVELVTKPRLVFLDGE
jgi:ABC-type lipoprotein export system ATPase subunit